MQCKKGNAHTHTHTCTKSACAGSSPLNLSGVGKRLGADQKGAPVEVVASSGKVKISCAIL